MNSSLKRIFVLTNRNLKEIIRDPLSLIFMIVVPLLLEVVFYLIFHSLTAQFEMRYLAPGIVAFSQSFLTLFTGLLIAVDRETSFLTRLYVSKAKSAEFIISYALAVIPLSLVQSILFFLVGGIIDSSLFGLGMIYGILLSIVTAIFFIACGILCGSLCNSKSIGGIASIVIMGQSVLSGMWFPTEGLSGGMLKVMKILPFKNTTTLLQNVVNGTITSIFNDFLLPLIIVLSYALVILLLAILIFRKKMKQ